MGTNIQEKISDLDDALLNSEITTGLEYRYKFMEIVTDNTVDCGFRD